MIGTTLQFVTRQINQFLCNQLQIDAAQRKIILASHVSADGTFGGLEENSLLLCLIGIRRESNANRQPSFPGTTVPSAGSAPLPAFVKRAPPLHLNLQVLLAANFRSDQIESGLNLLTWRCCSCNRTRPGRRAASPECRPAWVISPSRSRP
jgi:hypothetical protein